MKQIAQCAWAKELCKFWGKYSWILSNALIIVIILFLLLNDEFICCERWQRIVKVIHEFLNNHVLFTGLLGTIIGLIIVFWICKPHLYILKPQIEQNEGALYVVTRFYNTGLFKVHSVQVDLQGYWYEENKERKTETITLVKSDIPVMGGIFAKASDRTYRVWSKEPLPEDNMFDTKWEGIRCRVSATNSFSGLTYVYEKEISIDAIKNEYNEKLNVK